MVSKFIRYSLITLSFVSFISGYILDTFNLMLIGVLLLLLNNIIYSFENIKNRMFFLTFNIVIFVFLISRPTISMFRGNIWWYFNYSSVLFALNGLFITLLFLFIGSVFAEETLLKKQHLELVVNKKQNDDYLIKFITALRIISLVLFYICMIFYLIQEFEKLMFMRGKDYVEYYTSFKTKLPYVFVTLASMQKYLLCIFLSTMPKKHLTIIPLGLYVVSAIPALIIGMRNPIVLNLLFVFLYFCLRDAIENKHKWIGHFERAAIIILLPIAMAFLGAYNYIRDNASVKQFSIFDLIIDFIYKQGVSFDVLCIGHGCLPKISMLGFKNYTFGTFIDYFTHGTFAQKLLGAKSLGTGNNMDMALYSNSFAHNMSYISRGQEYLDGHGWGSSYILETYADFGYMGIIIFSLFLGFLLTYFIHLINKNWFFATLVLMSLTSIFFMPRDAATGWLMFVVTLQCILPLTICYLVSKLCIKDYSYKNLIYKRAKGM